MVLGVVRHGQHPADAIGVGHQVAELAQLLERGDLIGLGIVRMAWEREDIGHQVVPGSEKLRTGHEQTRIGYARVRTEAGVE